jgi:hypothetical protein
MVPARLFVQVARLLGHLNSGGFSRSARDTALWHPISVNCSGVGIAMV